MEKPPVPSARRIRARLRMRHLELLLALGDQRSLHKAATQMNMTQPAASKLLHEIEDMFELPLFTRSKQGVIPTAFGAALFHKAALLLTELDAARDELDILARGASGRVRVGALQVALPVLVPRTLAHLRQEHPGIVVMLQEGANDVLLTALARGELDCVVGRLLLTPSRPALRREALYEEPVCVVGRAGHPLGRIRHISPEVLARQQWILPPHEAPLRQSIDAYFIEHGVTPPVAAVESVSLLANDVLLRNSDFLAAMPLAVARYYKSERRQGLSILKFNPGWRMPPLGVVTRSDLPPSPLLEHFLSSLRMVANELRPKAGR